MPNFPDCFIIVIGNCRIFWWKIGLFSNSFLTFEQLKFKHSFIESFLVRSLFHTEGNGCIKWMSVSMHLKTY